MVEYIHEGQNLPPFFPSFNLWAGLSLTPDKYCNALWLAGYENEIYLDFATNEKHRCVGQSKSAAAAVHLFCLVSNMNYLMKGYNALNLSLHALLAFFISPCEGSLKKSPS